MSYHEQHLRGYVVSDDPSRLQLAVIHEYLSCQSYWSRGIPVETLHRALANSLCVGVYAEDGQQVGLARVITDRATYAWLCDVFVLPTHQKKGLGKALLRAVVSHPDLQGLRRLALATADAHELYAQFGFTPLEEPRRHMEKRNFRVYSAETREASGSS
jgi:GNAT superfamily N-acetyltransferase